MSDPETALLEESKHDAMIREDTLDEESGYSHVYLTSVYHDNIKELENILKTEFYRINCTGKTTLDEYLKKEIPSFNEEFNELELEIAKDKDEDDLKGTEHEMKQKPDLFFYALSVAVLTCIIQCAFIITIIKEYFNEGHLITSDPELITIRLLAFMTITLKLWIELCNGRKIFLQGVYHSYMFRNNSKRLLSTLMGGFQMFTALACYFCISELIVQTETVIDCVKDFSALIIVTEIDNWIGDYFINTSKQMQLYAGDNVKLISVISKKQYNKYSVADFCIDIIIVITFIVSIIPIYESVTFITN